MAIAIAREMLAYPKNESCSRCIFDHYAELVWDDYGEEVDVWNQIAKRRGLPTVQVEDGPNDEVYYVQGDRRLEVPFRFERGDNAISAHTLSQVLLPIVEFRLCVDTVGNSENAFIGLTPAEWKTLEKDFGKDMVDNRFSHMGKTVDEMWQNSNDAYDARG